MTDHIQLPPPDYTENVQGFVHDTQRHYYSEETMRAYAERLHAARVNSPAIMQAIGLLTTLQSWIGARSPQDSGPEEQTLWDQIEAARIALTPLAPAGAPAPAVQQGEPLAHWEDAQVQTVYRVLCADEAPAKGEHWEGWCARRIVDALAAQAHPAAPAAQGDALKACMRIIDECDTSNPAFHIAADALSLAATRSQAKEGGA